MRASHIPISAPPSLPPCFVSSDLELDKRPLPRCRVLSSPSQGTSHLLAELHLGFHLARPPAFRRHNPTSKHTSMAVAGLSHIKETLGAILLGCMFSTALSGMTAVQTFLYYRLYPKDPRRIKLLVIIVWLLDSMHSAFICAATWDYLILHFGDKTYANVIPISIALSVACTASMTFLTHLFFSHRIYRLSKKNWYITTPLVVLAFLRLGAALVSTAEMGKLKSYHEFVQGYGYVFTLGLSTASTLDLLIVAVMCYFLQINRTGFREMDHIIDTIMMYTVNNGALTFVTTVVSLICWLSMPGNLVFLGLHFAISKRALPVEFYRTPSKDACIVYANSLIGTLNGRRSLRYSRAKYASTCRKQGLPVMFPTSPTSVRTPQYQSTIPSRGEVELVSKLEISVEKTIEHDIDDGHLPMGGHSPA
ncbi:hypothetical protein BJV74DRAFT_848836 [Russula compacta]|nr:hypothetical protein BJV74DRAFT_848836 [Russula compacta]